MMLNFKIAAPLLAVATVLTAAPLAAEAPTTSVRRPPYSAPQARVSFADLDLRQRSGQRILDHRVRAAVKDVCSRIKTPPRLGLSMQPTCVGLTYRHARPQLAAAIHRVKSGQQQVAMALMITALTGSP